MKKVIGTIALIFSFGSVATGVYLVVTGNVTSGLVLLAPTGVIIGHFFGSTTTTTSGNVTNTPTSIADPHSNTNSTSTHSETT